MTKLGSSQVCKDRLIFVFKKPKTYKCSLIQSFLKEKCIITSIDTDKTFNKIQHKHMIKSFRKIRIEENFHTLIKNIYKKLLQNVREWWTEFRMGKWRQGNEVGKNHIEGYKWLSRYRFLSWVGAPTDSYSIIKTNWTNMHGSVMRVCHKSVSQSVVPTASASPGDL